MTARHCAHRSTAEQSTAEQSTAEQHRRMADTARQQAEQLATALRRIEQLEQQQRRSQLDQLKASFAAALEKESLRRDQKDQALREALEKQAP